MIEPGYDNLADFLHDVEGPEAAYAMYREGIEFIQGRGGAARWEQGESTWPLYVLGRWDEVLRVSDGLLAEEGQSGTSNQLPGLVLPEVARILAYRGRPKEARALIDRFCRERARSKIRRSGAVPRGRRSGRSRLWRSRSGPGTDARAGHDAKLVGPPLLGAA